MAQPIVRDIGVQHWDHAKTLHIQNNFPPVTIVSMKHNGWVYTLETYNEPKQPFNIYKNIYNLDFNSLNLDFQERNENNFNEKLINILSKKKVSPVYKEYIGPVG